MSVYQRLNIQPRRVLVVTMRYLGDTLFVTPLITSLKQAYPDASIDVLVPETNVAILAGNQDINRIIPIPKKPDLLGFVILLFKLFRQYDLAISTQAGDRPTICAIIAGKKRMGFVSEKKMQKWKLWGLDRALIFKEQHSHSVLENLRFCPELGIEQKFCLTPPSQESTNVYRFKAKYAVLHLMPQWSYKRWHESGWVALGYYLHEQGFQLILTGSAESKEMALIARVHRCLPPSTLNMAGKYSLAELTELIKHAGLFVGPDTGITHLAAATAVPTFALFGPTDPVKWGAWPINYAVNKSPFVARGGQRQGNVVIIQNGGKECVPCQQEGCLRQRESHSDCLDELTAELVIRVIEQNMGKS